ncbi:MAG: LemA family protein [Pseudomonadota bacterium]
MRSSSTTTCQSHRMVREGWSGISVQRQRRSDLIPNLLETVKGYMGHEKEVLENVTACAPALKAFLAQPLVV